MRKTLVLLGVALCMPISTISVNAAGLAGVTLPETSTVGDKSLVLNGVGLDRSLWLRSTSQGSTFRRSRLMQALSSRSTNQSD